MVLLLLLEEECVEALRLRLELGLSSGKVIMEHRSLRHLVASEATLGRVARV